MAEMLRFDQRCPTKFTIGAVALTRPGNLDLECGFARPQRGGLAIHGNDPSVGSEITPALDSDPLLQIDIRLHEIMSRRCSAGHSAGAACVASCAARRAAVAA